jgi:RNA polymerase sigma-70 factor (ECF subfamily)
VLEISAENVRITHHRARATMRAYDKERRPPCGVLQEQTRHALESLLRCLMTQDVAGLEALLVDAVRTVADGGGQYTALRGPLVGRAKVALLHLRVGKRRSADARVEIQLLNGLPAAVISYASAVRRQAPRAVLRCDVDADGRIVSLHSILTDRKLSAVSFPHN